MCRPVLCQPVSCRNRLVLNGKCTSHRIHVKLNVYVTFEVTSHWMYVTLNVRHLKCTAVSRQLAFSTCPSAFYLQDLNTNARYKSRAGIYWPLLCQWKIFPPYLPLLDCRPPLLVRVPLDGGRILSTSARTTDTCTAPLVADTGFQRKEQGRQRLVTYT